MSKFFKGCESESESESSDEEVVTQRPVVTK